MIGSWALILIHDYHNGLDFAQQEEMTIKLDNLFIINNQNVDDYTERVIQKTGRIALRTFSKSHIAAISHYKFNYDEIVRITTH